MRIRQPSLFPVVAIAIAVARFALMPISSKLSFVPDDAFYYLQLARQFARDGTWSFDRGQTLTSGFHVLWAYLLAALEHVSMSVNGRLGVLAALAGACAAGALVLLDAAMTPVFPKGRLAAVLYVGCAGGIVILPLQAMEWPLVLLVSALGVFALVRGHRELAALAFFLGPLCRFDFFVVGGCLLAASGIGWRALAPRTRQLVIVSVAACAAGVLVVSVHSHWLSDSWLPSSARTKAFWGSIEGYRLEYGIEPSSYAFGPFLLLTRVLDLGPLTLLAPIAALVVASWRARSLPPEPRLWFLWSALTIVVLWLAYARVGVAAQCWYGALFVAPFFVVAAGLGSLFYAQKKRVVGVGIGIALANLIDGRRPVWNESPRYTATVALATDDTIMRAGSWNAGAPQYFGGEKVMNLDGLVNDDVYPYLVADRLHCYLVHEKIPFIVDSMEWFDTHARILGGSDGRLRRHLTLARPQAPTRMDAWRVDLDALAKEPDCALDLRSARSRSLRP